MSMWIMLMTLALSFFCFFKARRYLGFGTIHLIILGLAYIKLGLIVVFSV